MCVRIHYTAMKWFHEISGCEFVVYGCSPIAVEHPKCCYFKIVDLYSH